MNKKVILIIVLLIFLVSILGGCKNLKDIAKVPDQPKDVREDIQGEGVPVKFYNKHRTTIDFMIMFALFCAVAMLGLNKFGAQGASSKAVAIAVGAALALAAMKAGYSPSFFIPFVKNALFLVIFFMIFMIVRQTMGGEAWLGPFLIALAVTFVAFNVGNIVMDKEKKFDLTSLWTVPTATKMEELRVDLSRTQSDLNIMAAKHGITPSASFESDAQKVERKLEQEIVRVQKLVSDTHRIKDESRRNEERKKLESQLKGLYNDRAKLSEFSREYSEKSNKAEVLEQSIKPSMPEVIILIKGDSYPPGKPLECQATSTLQGKTDVQQSDIIYDYIWLKNGVEMKQYTSRILPGEATTDGDSWKCKATPKAHGIEGPSGMSTRVKIVAGAKESALVPFDVVVRATDPKGDKEIDVLLGAYVTLEATATDGTKPYEYTWIQNPIFNNMEKVTSAGGTIVYHAVKEGPVLITAKVKDKSGIESESESFKVIVSGSKEFAAKAADEAEVQPATGKPDNLQANVDRIGETLQKLEQLLRAAPKNP